jgi:hypothetical protein
MDPFRPDPYTEEELFREFHRTDSFSKHLLTVYSLAIGLNAKTILDLGIGSTTKALRLAAAKTGGTVFSCDMDKARYGYLSEYENEHWKMFFGASEAFLKQVEAPIDFAMHDAAHDYYQVKLDLELLLPKMRTFGVICLHDTQQTELGHEMLRAIKSATVDWEISITNLPFGCGLAILRVERGLHPAIQPAGSNFPDGRFDTIPVAAPMLFPEQRQFSNADTSIKRWLRWRVRKLIRGF